MERSHVVLTVEEYNQMRDALTDLKRELEDCIRVSKGYDSEESASIYFNADEGKYIRSIINAKAAEVFKGPVSFKEKLELEIWRAENTSFVKPNDGVTEEAEEPSKNEDGNGDWDV